MSDNVERRNGTGSIRAKGGGKLGGLAIPTNVLSEDLGGFRERIAPGAFTDSIAKDDVRSLFNHDSSFVLGRLSAGTLRLSEGEDGISYEVDVPNAGWAKDLTESIRRGDIRENSFAFFVNEGGDTWVQTETGLERTVTRATLREIGPQPFAAYTMSTVDIRSLAATLERGKSCVGAACHRGGQDPDVLLRELDLNHRGRTGGEYSDVLDLERDLDEREPTHTAVSIRTREYPSESELRALLGNGFTNAKVRALAFHEAAHSVLAVVDGCRLDEVRLHWKRSGFSWELTGGKCLIRSGPHTVPMYLAGRLAEGMAGLGEASPMSWSSGDAKYARKYTKRGVVEDRRTALLVLRRHWPAVRALASALLDRQRIDGDEAEAIIVEHLDLATRSRLRAA